MSRHIPIASIKTPETRRALRNVVHRAVVEACPDATEEQIRACIDSASVFIPTPPGECTCVESHPDYCPVHAA